MPRKLPVSKKAAALLGFMVFGLSPSFVDWKQAPEDRKKIVSYYVVGLSLIYFGLLSD